ncbi:electron transport complex subunit RsxC [Myxococcota bacterium]|nr:electron transport complex subunit RsxC [Myxococcota bacterium]
MASPGAGSGPGTFRHGVHPDGAKEATEHLPVERMPFVERYTVPLAQHLGAPAIPVVQPGQRVQRGQLVARAAAFVSTAHHAPVTGTVVSIGKERYPSGALVEAIVIDADRFDPQMLAPGPAADWRSVSDKDFMALVQGGGIVGMGGAAFPSHVKLSVPEGKGCDQLVINGCECEPFLTCDHRTMVERPDAVLRGVDIAGTRVGCKGAVIGVELNKPDGISSLQAAIERRQARIARGDNDGVSFPIRVHGVQVKYPQGAEKMLIKALFDREVPAGKLPLDLGYVVNNVATMVALAELVDGGSPLIERVVTVSGSAVRRPANLLVPVGTPIRAVLDHCGGLTAQVRQVVMGGPMMGMPVATLDAPVLKGTSGLLAFEEARDPLKEAGPCIKCGQCLEACPYMLNPSRMGRLARAGRVLEMEDWLVMDCVECGACTWVCPSEIPLVHLFRSAKATIRKKKAAEQAAAKKAGGAS